MNKIGRRWALAGLYFFIQMHLTLVRFTLTFISLVSLGSLLLCAFTCIVGGFVPHGKLHYMVFSVNFLIISHESTVFLLVLLLLLLVVFCRKYLGRGYTVPSGKVGHHISILNIIRTYR